MKLTMEEEFRICELEVNRGHLIESFFRTLENKVPNFRIGIQLMLYSVTLGVSFDLDKGRVMEFQKRMKEAVTEDLLTGGQVNQAFNTLDILRDMPVEVKNLVVFPSIKRLNLCFRAFFKANSNKLKFVDQRKSVGLSCVNFFDKVIGKGSLKTIRYDALQCHSNTLKLNCYQKILLQMYNT